MEINWDPFNLTMNMDAKVEISLWGYRETTIEPELIYIASLESNVANRGKVSGVVCIICMARKCDLLQINVIPADFADRDDGPLARSCRMGLLMINLTNPVAEVGMANSP